MKQSNKEPGPDDRWMARAVRYLRDWSGRHGRTVHDQVLRGVSYGVGSGAVSLLVLWYETRR
ncbi:hypothetical protein OIA45_49040 (plasmid) [Streptomyces chartreusis]|uniref:hypothetical protein n=1 Tax=Streptomyces chartreusis TaxID=1969 RepID=UPI003863CFAE|nr:hypothetical protein OIA45_49040 [Streptomyces chartreusis]